MVSGMLRLTGVSAQDLSGYHTLANVSTEASARLKLQTELISNALRTGENDVNRMAAPTLHLGVGRIGRIGFILNSSLSLKPV